MRYDVNGNIIKSGIEFLAVIGYILIGIGVVGAIGIIASFDWETYNEAASYSFGLDDDVVKPNIISMWTKSGTSLIGCGAIGAFFIAMDKIALILKKIQLGIKYDPKPKPSKRVESIEDEGYGTLR